MALVKAKSAADRPLINYVSPVAAKIQQRRYQMLVHSLIYYELDINIVPDSKWSEWAMELVQLQKDYPDIASQVIFADAFKDFDGSSGCDLPYRDEQIINIAYRLLKSRLGGEEARMRLRDCVEPTPAEYEKYKKKSFAVSQSTVEKKEVKPVDKKQRKGLFSVPRS